jgi:hypothetical protein
VTKRAKAREGDVWTGFECRRRKRMVIFAGIYLARIRKRIVVREDTRDDFV